MQQSILGPGGLIITSILLPPVPSATMAHIVEMPASLNTAIMFGLIGCGLMACVIGALMYDAGRLFSAS